LHLALVLVEDIFCQADGKGNETTEFQAGDNAGDEQLAEVACQTASNGPDAPKTGKSSHHPLAVAATGDQFPERGAGSQQPWLAFFFFLYGMAQGFLK